MPVREAEARQMPKPGEAHARLGLLVGRWQGRETMFPAPWDPTGGTATAVVDNRVVLDGFAVVQEYQQSRDNGPGFAGHAVLWWDPAADQHVMTWFDAMSGTPTEYRGGFDGDVLTLTSAVAQGGFSRCTFDCRTPDRYVFMLEVSADGHIWTPVMEGAYRRQRPGAAAPAATRARRAQSAKGTAAAKRRAAAKTTKVRTRAKTAAARPRRTASRLSGTRGGRRRR
jgi:hypothetical protein